MSKQLIKNYTFNTTAKTITLTDFASLKVERLMLITDIATKQFLYNFGDASVVASVAGNVITLSAIPGSSANADSLQIIYDCLPGDPIYDITPVQNAVIEEYQDTERQTIKVTNPVFVNAFQAGGAIATGTVIAPTHDIGDVSFMSITVNTGGTWVGAITIQQSDDQSLFTDSLIYNTASLDTPPTTTITANGRYIVRKSGRYMKAYYSLFASGAAATMTVHYFTSPYADFQRFTTTNPMPTSLASAPLPTGAALEAGNLATIATNTGRIPTGAALEAGNLSTIATNTGRIPTQGQATKSNSTPVTIASDQGAFQTTATGASVTGLTAAAINDKLVNDYDVSNYGSFSLQVGGTFTASLTFSGSNDGAQFFNCPVLSITSASAAAVATQTTTGIYEGNCPFKYLRVTVSAVTSITSMTGALFLSSVSKPFQTMGVLAAQTGTWSVTTQPLATSTALSNFTSQALTTTTQVKGSSGRWHKYFAYNPNASTVYMQVFNKLAASVTLGTTVPDEVYAIPASGVWDGYWHASSNWTTGISVAATTTAGGNTAPTTGLLVNLGWL
jgi:hypothetical protein